jgi:hypothetical protein
MMLNGTLVQSQAGGNQTFAIKTLAGADPSTSDPVYFLFRDVTPATGDYFVRSVTAALNITINSNSNANKMGFINSTAGRIWIGALDNAGTVELFVLNALTVATLQTYPLRGWGIITTSAVSAATSAGVPYSTTARTAVAYMTIGYAAWESGGTMATAGNWNAPPSRMQIYQAGSVPLPGEVVQGGRSVIGSEVETSVNYTLSNTAPLPANGSATGCSIVLVLTSGANIYRSRGQAVIGTNAGTNLLAYIIVNGTTNVATASTYAAAANTMVTVPVGAAGLIGGAGSTTYALYFSSSSNNSYLNSNNHATPLFNGTGSSYLEVEEIMA